MKKIYCKYCGLELENGSCHCEQFLRSENKKSKENRICDTCDKRIDEDSVYCPYCGIPQDINGEIRELQKELRGENAIDVLELYKNKDLKKGVKRRTKKTSKATILFSALIMLAMGAISYSMFIKPIIDQKINEYKMNKELEEALAEHELTREPTSESTVEETTQPVIELKDTWVKRDGFFYAFDKNGDPVVDDWVIDIDENGNEQKYYFDIDGKLVVNSWIDGEYYVGADGAMLRDQDTPDGAHVDEDGRVLLKLGEGVAVDRETQVYYEYPGAKETVAASTMKSNLSGEIKGVDSKKKYELYVKNILQERETIKKGDLRCNITYYVPQIAGVDEREVQTINEKLKEAFGNFKNTLVSIANSETDLPKSIVFNTIEQRTLNSNRMNILAHGKVTPRKGLVYKKKFRFVYDRKSKKVTVTDISE